jgi:ubiquinol-cytochrome c reductase cytochrome b subunit
MPSFGAVLLMPVDRRAAGLRVTDRLAARLAATGTAHRVDELRAQWRSRAVPNHWTTWLGVVPLTCIVVIFATGLLLMFLYTPSSTRVMYDGSYLPLHGVEMSRALESTLYISFDVRGGLLLRQLHHWAALLLPASLVLQLLTIFFTGGFRRPRRGSWVLLVLIFLTTLIGGWSGYALPDDMLSGSGLRIVEGVAQGIPILGSWLAALLFGGSFPGRIIEHLYPVHVLIAPAALAVLVALRAAASYSRRPAQWPGTSRTEQNVIGMPLLPNAATRALGLAAATAGVLVLIAAAVRIAPVWEYGPSDPGNASAGSQPDWYTGFLDGALRLIPPGWEFEWLGYTWTLAIVVPLAAIGLFFVLVAAYPFVEAWVRGDAAEHHLLDRPRATPTRTGIGVAGLIFIGGLWAAASSDLIATTFRVSVEAVVLAFQAFVLVAPAAGFFIARSICLALVRKDTESLAHGFETGRIVRLPGGEYIEVHRPLDPAERARLAPARRLPAIEPVPDRAGRVSPVRLLQSRLNRLLFRSERADESDQP